MPEEQKVVRDENGNEFDAIVKDGEVMRILGKRGSASTPVQQSTGERVKGAAKKAANSLPRPENAILNAILNGISPAHAAESAIGGSLSTLVGDVVDAPGRTVGQNVGAIGGGVLGGRLAGTPGAIAGSGIGKALGGMLGQGISPTENVNVGENVLAGAEDIAMGGAISLASKLPGLISNKNLERQFLANDIAEFFGSKSKLTPEQLQAFKQGNVQLTRGQVTGNQAIEDLLAPREKETIVGQQQLQNISTLPNKTPPPPMPAGQPPVPPDLGNIPFVGNNTDTGKAGANVALGQVKALKGRENSYNKKVLDLAPEYTQKNTTQVPSIVLNAQGQPVMNTATNATKIKGPITLLDTKKAIDSELSMLESQLGMIEDTGVKTQFRALTAELAGLKGKDVVPFEEIRAIKGNLYDLVSKANRWKLTKAEAGLNNLANALDEDLKFSVANWKMPKGYTGAPASTWLERANKVTQTRFNRFNDYTDPKLRNALGEGVKFERAAFPSELFKDSFATPDAARQSTVAFGKRPTGQAFVNQLSDKFFNAAGPAIKGVEALEYIKKPETQEIMRQFLNKDQRAALTHFFNRASVMDPRGKSQVGTMALRFAEGNAAISAGSEVFKGNIGSGLLGQGAAKLSIIFGGKYFARNVLLNPAQARIAAGLIAKPQASSMEIKTLLGAMRGVPIVIKTAAGKRLDYNAETGEISEASK